MSAEVTSGMDTAIVELTVTNEELIDQLKEIVGASHVITNTKSTRRFRKGFRSGEGEAIAVVRPGTLLEKWKVLEACVAADKIVVFQAANTGLTAGSTPFGTYDREVVLLNTMRIDGIQLLDGGNQVVTLPGATLFQLEKVLKPVGRLPHSVIGSSSIGASVVGGICNNSGGSLIERGPAYTELALFAQVDAAGKLNLVNHLGIRLGDDPETILTRLENGDYSDADLEATNASASDTDYIHRIRDVDADTPSRFNADPGRLFEASGCAGKLAVFAVRLDTFAKNDSEQVFYLGTNDTRILTRLRRDLLPTLKTLPVSTEYMHCECYDISKRYGKDTLVMIDKLGTDRLPMIFAMKGWLDARLNKVPLLPRNLIDRVMQGVANLWPNVLPKRLEAFRQRFEHHMIIKAHDDGIEEIEAYLRTKFDGGSADWFACSTREGKIAGLHRFAAAGAAVRYMAVNEGRVSDILALDIALRRNDEDWFEVLPPEIEEALEHKLYYGHFFCHVMHQDYVVKAGYDANEVKAKMIDIIEQRGAKFPSEHNVGHMYRAEEGHAAFFQQCDPTNSLNPGLGKMSRKKHYA